MSRFFRDLVVVSVCLLCLYVGTYALLSVNGRYEPAAWGVNGVKWYGWAPAGFVQDFEWSGPLLLAFAPLYALDKRLWHTDCDSDADCGSYPINRLD